MSLQTRLSNLITAIGTDIKSILGRVSTLESQVGFGLFGDGSDGAVVLDGTISPVWATKAGSVYVLQRDVFFTNLTINAGVTLWMGGWRLFCTGTLTNNGTITQQGMDGVTDNLGTVQQPGLPTATNTLTTNRGTSASGTTVGAGGGGSLAAGGGGRGGTGGTGGSGSGGINNTPPAFSVALWKSIVLPIFPTTPNGGSGGGGGGNVAPNRGGQGGNGGGVVLVYSRSIINNGTISTRGGNGSVGTSGNVGGGAGGGGGLVILYTTVAMTGTGTINVAGGTGAAGLGTGTAGSDGSPGGSVNVVLS